MRPRSIAIVGISPEPSSAGFLALRNLEDFEYSGAVHLVSRNQTNIGSRACVRAIDDLPEGIDAAMLFMPRAAIEDAVAACARRGVGGVVIFAAGFGEAGGNGRRPRSASPLTHARPGWRCAARIASASSISRTGFRSPSRVRSGDASRFHPVPSSSRKAADLRASCGRRSRPKMWRLSARSRPEMRRCSGSRTTRPICSKIQHQGGCCLRRADLKAAALSRDGGTGARARQACRPAVVGHSAAARESAKSHTGALAGDYAVIEALLRHACVMLVQSLEELFDVAELALRFPAPPSKGLAMVTDFGAIKGLALDYCETLGLDLPPLPRDLGATIQAELPDFVDASNPLDLTAQAITHPEMYERTIKPLLADDAYGSLLLAVIIGEASDFAVAKGKACLEPLMGSPKPAILGLLGDEVNCRRRSFQTRVRPGSRSIARLSARCVRWRA